MTVALAGSSGNSIACWASVRSQQRMPSPSTQPSDQPSCSSGTASDSGTMAAMRWPLRCTCTCIAASHCRSITASVRPRPSSADWPSATCSEPTSPTVLSSTRLGSASRNRIPDSDGTSAAVNDTSSAATSSTTATPRGRLSPSASHATRRDAWACTPENGISSQVAPLAASRRGGTRIATPTRGQWRRLRAGVAFTCCGPGTKGG